jgi:hypothetical protein
MEKRRNDDHRGNQNNARRDCPAQETDQMAMSRRGSEHAVAIVPAGLTRGARDRR